MSNLAIKGVEVALRNMFEKKGHFSICTVEACARALKHEIPSEARDTLALFHCVKWGDMDPSTRREIAFATLEALGADVNRNLLPPTFR